MAGCPLEANGIFTCLPRNANPDHDHNDYDDHDDNNNHDAATDHRANDPAADNDDLNNALSICGNAGRGLQYG